jgi:hypothetical protein
VTHLGGHGTVTLPADYVHEHVRLGYAATEPGNQSDTVTTGLTLATPATTGRGLYVAITRGHDENLILVITDTHDIGEARDILEGILVSDRADIPAVTQRRHLDQQQPRQPQRHPRCQIPDWYDQLRAEVAAELAATRGGEHQAATVRRQQHAGQLEAAQRKIDTALAATTRFDNAIQRAREQLDAAQHRRREASQAFTGAHLSTRRPARQALAAAEQHLANAQARFQTALDAAAPAQRELTAATVAHKAIRDDDFYQSILDRWTHHPRRITQLQQRQHALADRRWWAVGEPVTIEHVATLVEALHVAPRSPFESRYTALQEAVTTWSARHRIDITPPPSLTRATCYRHVAAQSSSVGVGP